MQRLTPILILFWIAFGCIQKQKMNFETYTRRLFFNADITNKKFSLINYYRTLDNLKEEKYEGFTIYPPLSTLGQDENPGSHIFKFKMHQELPFDFEEGELGLQTRKTEESLPTMKIIFRTKEEAEKAFQALVKEYNAVSTSKKIEKESWAKTAEFNNKGSKFMIFIVCDSSKDNTLLIVLENKSDSPKE